MTVKLLFFGAGHNQHIGAVWTGKAHFALACLGGFGCCPAVSALEGDDVGDDRAIMTAIGGARNAGVDFFLDQISLAFADDAEFRLRWVRRVDGIYPGHRVRIHRFND